MNQHSEEFRSDTALGQDEIDRQNQFIDKIREKISGKEKKYCIVTFGCQMNARDSEKLSAMLLQMGYHKTEQEDEADFILYNTCCVRENAENKVYGKLGHLKNKKAKKPGLLIALCGCMMQEETVLQTIRTKYKHVDIVFGTFNIYKLPELLYTRFETDTMVLDIWQAHKEIVEDLPSERKYPFKAGVNVMYGCDNFCSYCIVPYVRGRERSRAPRDILREVQNLAADGVKEIMFLGQNVNSYGKHLEEPITFAKLLQMVHDVDGLERIRFMTSHPKDLSGELIDTMANYPKICRHLHLPFQAGSSRILQKMNRRYTKEDYLRLADAIQTKIPDIHLTTDIMVGFPEETEEDFQDTLDVLKKVRFAGAFTFIYSKRTGTPAATMTDQVPEDVVKDRFQRLLDTINPIVAEISSKQVGQTVDVLVEEINERGQNLLTGRLSNNSLVHFEATPSLIGEILPVKITQSKGFYLLGEIAAKE